MSPATGNQPAPGLQDRELCCRLGQGEEHHLEEMLHAHTSTHTCTCMNIPLMDSLLKAPREVTWSPCKCLFLNRLM